MNERQHGQRPEWQPDRLFAGADAPASDFVFDQRVARVFADMLDRSVPCYRELIRLIGLLAARHVGPAARVLDLGCSLGAASASILARLPDPDLRILAVDNAPAMIDELRRRLSDAVACGRVETRCADVSEVAVADVDIVLLNLTLQFLPRTRRLALLQRIHAGLAPDGVLILVEKVDWPDVAVSDLMNGLHLDFKRAHGYSELEISRKRAALEQVLLPDSIEVHEERLSDAGFTCCERWFQCLNFVGWLAWP
mgnify:CR=1 FL=1